MCVPGIAGGHTLPTTTGQREGLPVKMIANDDHHQHRQHHDHHDDIMMMMKGRPTSAVRMSANDVEQERRTMVTDRFSDWSFQNLPLGGLSYFSSLVGFQFCPHTHMLPLGF